MYFFSTTQIGDNMESYHVCLVHSCVHVFILLVCRVAENILSENGTAMLYLVVLLCHHQ